MTGIQRLRKLIEDYRAGRECDGVECTELSCGKCMAKNVLEPIADQIERESDVETVRSEAMDAWRWVREHGGLEKIKRQRLESVPRDAYERHLARRQRQIDESHAALRRRNRWIAELEHLLCKEMSYSLRRDAGCLARENAELRKRGETIRELSGKAAKQSDEIRVMRDVIAETCARLGVEGTGSTVDDAQVIWREISRRLMPEGMEWLLDVWPKWSNGEYCKFGDWWKSDKYGEPEPNQFSNLSIYTPEQLREWGQDDGDNYGYEWDFVRPSDPKYRPDKAEPPAPKVLDADGVEIREGDTV